MKRLLSKITGGYSVSLRRVHDRITVREGNEEIVLRVDADPAVIVRKIRNANQLITEAGGEEATEDERRSAAVAFGTAIFGQEQTEKILEFYNGDYVCLMTVCGKYFEERLSGKIAKAQMKKK